jgi:hypothetical protein
MRDRLKDVVLKEIREKSTMLPGMNVSGGQAISHRVRYPAQG